MKRKTRNNKSEPEVTGIYKLTLMRKKVSYINIRGVHVIFLQLRDVATSEKLPDNQEEKKKLTREREGKL